MTHRQPADPGLRCPGCGKCRTLRQVWTRHKPGQTVRVRRCRECLRRVVTIERIVSEPPPVTDA